MAEHSKIEWTQATWNPVTGCTKVSAGCKHCYAERLSGRLQQMGVQKYRNAFEPTLHEEALLQPLRWSKPRVVFVNSMSDLFHEQVPSDFINRVFEVMEQCPHHTFQVLTKRSQRLAQLSTELQWPLNVWMGVSIENGSVLHRVDDLRKVPARTRFLSCEPLLGPLDGLSLAGIGWVIVGGESGPGARSVEPAWVESILRECQQHRIPFFFKQWGGTRKDLSGRLLFGRTYDEMPALP